MSGVALSDRPAFLKKLETFSIEQLKDESGIPEIDGRPEEEVKEEEEQSKLYGALTILGHIGDVFVRRFANPTTGAAD